MKKILGTLVLFLALLLPTAVIQSQTTPASAVSGCTSRVVDKVDTWGNSVGYVGLNLPSRVPASGATRLSGSTVYAYCPGWASTNNDNKIKVKSISWCWTDYPSKVDNFRGAKFNANFFSDGPDVNTPEYLVADNNGWQNCRVQEIRPSSRKWQLMGDSPGWTVSSWIVLSWQPDWEDTFKYDGNSHKYFHPSKDPNVSKWYR